MLLALWTAFVIGGGGFAIYHGVFLVEADQEAVLLRLGEPERNVPPGIHFKIPIVDQVIYCEVMAEHRLEYPRFDVTLADASRTPVDAEVYYRIGDCLQFHKTVRTDGALQSRLRDLGKTSVRRVFERYPARNLFERDDEIVTAVHALLDPEAVSLGAEVLLINLQYPQK